ncbi:hypothetical protein C0Q70_09630 [Pomacea canaliculata]|uniref:Cyclic nucleotide-binding domain-containing protein n=1 Tax=Pomacea canaliculata TaxID=400727 RepID=A0A2T7PAD1_POMCA|nr:hypothetical protein C0Q70_09630 [Pomacea canaliculata]
MALLLDQVVEVIAKPPARRTEADVTAVCTFLREKSELLSKTDSATLPDIVLNCTYETADCDDVIIRQGEEGDRMYIILRGVIAIYIDAVMTGEEDPSNQSPTRRKESPDTKKTSQPERAGYGRFITTYGPGRYFGEAALMAEDHVRNATIIANSRCDFLVIDQELFDRCLKDSQQKEFREIQNFVDTHPFFCHMSAKLKRLLQLSFCRETFAFDTTIVKQGDKRDRLVFITSGQANIIIEPGQHQKQYSHLWPFEAGIDVYYQEFEWLRESRKKAILRMHRDPTLLHIKPPSLQVRRHEGYAASERRRQDLQVCLCSVRDGEVLGDVELALNLSTYLQTVVCTTETQVLVLHMKNLERVTGRRNPVTMAVIREHAIAKLNTRRASKYGHQVQLLHYLYTKLIAEEFPNNKKLPPLKTSKAPPSRETQRQHMLSKYLEGKAQLVEPYGVPGGLIYKDLMAEKSRIRANIRRRGTLGVGAVVRAARRKVNSRQPRSRRQLIESLREMMEAQLVDVGREGPKKGQGHEGHASSRTSVARPELPSRPPNALPSLTTDKVGRSPEKSAQKQFMSSDKSSDSKRLKLPPVTPGKTDGSSGGGVVLTKSVDSRSALSMPLIREETEDTGGTQVVDARAGTQEMGEYETSEVSLNFLETRVKQFVTKYTSGGPSKVNIKLPALRRFKLDLKVDEEDLPKPGGKVWIKKRMCRFANSKVMVKGHEHIRYHIVEELPEFDSVKKMQHILHQMLDGVRTTAEGAAETATVPTA